MAEFHSPLYSALITGRYGSESNEHPVRLAEQRIGMLLQLAGWQAFDTAADEFLRQLGTRLPADYRTVETTPDLRVYRVAPDRVLIRSDRPQALPTFDPSQLVTLDLSHSKIALALTGSCAADVLSRSAPMDVGVQLSAPGQFVQTCIHEVSVLIERADADRFNLLVPYTWAASVLDRLCRAAEPFGYEITS